MELSAALRRTAAELGLAATVSVGSRTTRLRTLLTAFGVGLALLVSSASLRGIAARRPFASRRCRKHRTAAGTVPIAGRTTRPRVRDRATRRRT